jgi:hypothetical protein
MMYRKYTIHGISLTRTDAKNKRRGDAPIEILFIKPPLLRGGSFLKREELSENE